MTNAVVILNTPNATNELHSITVTCTIHPNSTADQCVVMAMADGRVTRTGMCVIITICYKHVCYIRIYVCVLV